jgi:hypothetical protein
MCKADGLSGLVVFVDDLFLNNINSLSPSDGLTLNDDKLIFCLWKNGLPLARKKNKMNTASRKIITDTRPSDQTMK